ncbi:MAG: arsenate reductase ArsC [Acidobacteriota bacterium]
MRKKILFICTHNSARSQMAEGLTNHFFNNEWEAFSAGTEKTFVKPMAAKALKDIGIDISHHRSKLSTEFAGFEFDIIVTVCDNAKDNCPFFPGAKKYVHKGFKDPSDTKGSDEAVLEAFSRSRDEIHNWLKNFLSR